MAVHKLKKKQFHGMSLCIQNPRFVLNSKNQQAKYHREQMCIRDRVKNAIPFCNILTIKYTIEAFAASGILRNLFFIPIRYHVPEYGRFPFSSQKILSPALSQLPGKNLAKPLGCD